MTRTVRSILRLAKLGLVFLLARLEGIRLRSPLDRAAWQQRQALRVLRALDVDVRVLGSMPRRGLVVCNHLGYLDICVLAAQGPAVFVAKSDLRNWPAIGDFLRFAGAILAKRGRPLTAGETGSQIRLMIHDNIPVVLFPEGTSSDGSSVLPFKPSLLQAALDAGAPITPAAICYGVDGGNAADEVCYWGDAVFLPHLIRLAGLPKVVANLSFGDAPDGPPKRKQLAAVLRAEVWRLKMRNRCQVRTRICETTRPVEDGAGSSHAVTPSPATMPGGRVCLGRHKDES